MAQIIPARIIYDSMSDDEPVSISLADAQRYAQAQIDAIPPTKYEVSPSEAYVRGGSPNGPMYRKGGRRCPSCGEAAGAAYYSAAGLRELNISGLCEPCFDWNTWPSDEVQPEWMSLVQYRKES